MKKEKAIGAGIGIAALAAVGAYFLSGKRGAKNREAIKGWTLKMKGEVLEKVEKVKKLDKDDYEKIVDEVAERYGKLEKVGAAELKRLTAEMKKAWDHIKKNLK
jgi:DNA-directed RNA polymerase subunit F